MAIPAVAFLVDPVNTRGMAADAVGLHHQFLALGNFDHLRRSAGIKDDRVFETVDGFPDIIGGHVLVRKVAIDTSDRAMGADMEPRLVLGLHDMAGRAEKRGFGLGQQLRRPKTYKNTDSSHTKHRDKNLPFVFLDHTHRFETSPE